MKTKTYAFDFDGTMTNYEKFRGHDIVDEPRPEVVKAIQLLRSQGNKIIIYSTRSNEVLKKWCDDNNVIVDYFNENPEYQPGNPGKPVAYVYIDDRAICYNGQTAEELVEELNNFEVFYKEKTTS